MQYRWAWLTNVNTTSIDASHQSEVAVIDGDQVLMTPFRAMTVPPPMCAYSLRLNQPVNQVLISPCPDDGGGYDVICVLSNTQLAVFSYKGRDDGKLNGFKLL